MEAFGWQFPLATECGGMTAMEAEETDLERRVLAHARILKTLIRYLAEDTPEILERLKLAFRSGHNISEYEQDFSSTEQYGDVFMRSVEIELRLHRQI